MRPRTTAPLRALAPRLALGLALVAALPGPLAGCATAGPGAAARRAAGAEAEGLVTLPSGLRLAVLQRPGAPRFLLATSVLCGAEDDPPGRAGLAHLVEHLGYRARGPDGRPRRAALAAAGAAFNARTTPDATEHWLQALPGALDAALAVEAARLADPLAGITEADLDAEREVLVRELLERATFHRGAATRAALQARVFAGRPEGRAAGGEAGALRGATLPEARALAEACWRPERAVVALVGPWPPAEGLARLRAALAAHPALAGDPARPVAPAARPPLPPPPAPGAALATLPAPVRAPVLLLGWAVPLDGADLPRAQAARSLLTAYLGGRLGAEDLQRRVVGLAVELVPFDRTGLMVAAIDLAAEGDAAPVLAACRDVLVELRTPGAAFRAVAPLRRALALEAALALDRLDAAALLRHLRAGGGAAWAAEGEALAAEALPDVAHGLEGWAFRHLSRERSAAVLLLPDPAAAPPALAGGAGLADEEHPARDAAEADGAAAAPDAPPEAAAAGDGPPAAAPAPLVRLLPNGLTVVVAPRPGAGLAEARLVLRAPLLPGEPGALPAFTLAVRGARSDERWLHAGRLGARTVQRGTAEGLVVAERARGEDLPRLAEDLGRLPGGFELPEARLRVTAERMARAVEASGRDPTEQATRALLARLFPGHPAGAAPDAAATGALGEAAVRRYLSRALRPEAATLLLVGDAPPEQAFAAAAEALGGWRGAGASGGRAGAAPAPRPPPAPAGNHLQQRIRPGARQALLLAGWRLPPAAARDEAAFLALARHLEATLDEALRERGGVSYGVHAARLDLGAEGALVLEAAVDAPAAMAALDRMIAAVAAVARRPPGPAAAARLGREVALAAVAREDGVAATADALEADVLAGRAPGSAAALATSARALDGARLAAAAALLAGKEQVVVLGDPSLAAAP